MSTQRVSAVRLLAPPLGLMLVNFGLSSIPGTTSGYDFLGFVPPQLQNLLHLPFYGLMAWLWYGSLRGFGHSRNRAVVQALAICFIWGLLDEFHQYFVPGRFTSLNDIAFNTAGTLIVAAIILRKKL